MLICKPSFSVILIKEFQYFDYTVSVLRIHMFCKEVLIIKKSNNNNNNNNNNNSKQAKKKQTKK